ncbi:MAG: adenylosuccinate lyase [Firmicutes bacterium]|nr:adenylosuccinate lyase [Bacillota bacterium]
MHNVYQNPLITRYASKTMQAIFSDKSKFVLWRRLWVALAKAQKELGLEITSEQIKQLEKHTENIDFERASQIEKETRHDVMAHIKAYGEVAKEAKPIIHLGATSCYVGDNTDIILQRDALLHIKRLLVSTIDVLAKFAKQYKDLPTLAFTHYQPAQPTTVGKRASLWLNDLLLDLERLEETLAKLKFFGCKGATGTAASMLELFNGKHAKVIELEKKIAKQFGFDKIHQISGQTYSRKIDYFVLSVLSGIAQSAYKFSNDIRLLSNLKEIEEPFEKAQVGSSAMPYKRNPMRSERIAALARYVSVGTLNTSLTASAQWLERTLDDSANRRIVIPQSFLAVDAILSLYINVAGGLVVNKGVIEKNLRVEIPFLATENILMYCVTKGGDRQDLHNRIKEHSMRAGERIRNGETNDLLDRILADKAFKLTKAELDKILSANFTGRAAQQVEEFLPYVQQVLKTNKSFIGAEVEIKV